MRREKPLGTQIRTPPSLKASRASIKCVGCYHLADEESDWPLLVELIITAPRYQLIPVSNIRLYTPCDWYDPPSPIVPEFILDATGETLIGSYLHPSDGAPAWTREMWRLVTVRFASFLPTADYGTLLTPMGMLHLPDSEPIPERLLRLIWADL